MILLGVRRKQIPSASAGGRQGSRILSSGGDSNRFALAATGHSSCATVLDLKNYLHILEGDLKRVVESSS